MDDPRTWTRSWKVALALKRAFLRYAMYEYACHEGNYGMRNILSGARAEEKGATGSSDQAVGALLLPAENARIELFDSWR